MTTQPWQFNMNLNYARDGGASGIQTTGGHGIRIPKGRRLWHSAECLTLLTPISAQLCATKLLTSFPCHLGPGPCHLYSVRPAPPQHTDGRPSWTGLCVSVSRGRPGGAWAAAGTDRREAPTVSLGPGRAPSTGPSHLDKESKWNRSHFSFPVWFEGVMSNSQMHVTPFPGSEVLSKAPSSGLSHSC